jgi:hypothetical protein
MEGHSERRVLAARNFDCSDHSRQCVWATSILTLVSALSKNLLVKERERAALIARQAGPRII